jgi:S-formylglutathione hydrolase
MEIKQKQKCHGGYVYLCQHSSDVLGCKMNFRVFLPYSENENEKFPVLYYL